MPFDSQSPNAPTPSKSLFMALGWRIALSVAILLFLAGPGAVWLQNLM